MHIKGDIYEFYYLVTCAKHGTFTMWARVYRREIDEAKPKYCPLCLNEVEFRKDRRWPAFKVKRISQSRYRQLEKEHPEGGVIITPL